MTEHQYPIHLRKIGEHQIAEFLETLMIELDTHEKMFLELCQLRREKDALREIVRGRCDSITDLSVSKDSVRVALKFLESYINTCSDDAVMVDHNPDEGFKFYLRSDREGES